MRQPARTAAWGVPKTAHWTRRAAPAHLLRNQSGILKVRGLPTMTISCSSSCADSSPALRRACSTDLAYVVAGTQALARQRGYQRLLARHDDRAVALARWCDATISARRSRELSPVRRLSHGVVRLLAHIQRAQR